MLKFRNKHETRFICCAEGDEPALGGETPGNDPAARNADGSLKNQAQPEKKVEGEVKPELNADGTPKKVEEKKPEDKKPDEKKPEGAPEKYDLKGPDEKTALDPKLLEQITPIFKELGISNEGAQKLVDFHNKQITAANEGAINAFIETRNGWRTEIINNAELGNGKDDLKPEVKATIGRMIDALPNGVDFRKAMDQTGAGDNPVILAGLLALAKGSTEGRPVSGAGPAKPGQTKPGDSEGKSIAQRIYPNLPSANSQS